MKMRAVAWVKSVKIDDEPSVSIEFKGAEGGRGATGHLWTKDAELRDWWKDILPGMRLHVEILPEDIP